MKRVFTYALPPLKFNANALDFGQLGRALGEELAEPILDHVALGTCGLLHTQLVTIDGTVFSCGKAAGGRLANGDPDWNCFAPHPSFKLLDGLPRSISAGAAHGALVTSQGQLLAWGYDSVR